MTNEKGTEHQLLTESAIFYRKCFSYSSHIMIIQNYTQPDRYPECTYSLLTPYLLFLIIQGERSVRPGEYQKQIKEKKVPIHLN